MNPQEFKYYIPIYKKKFSNFKRNERLLLDKDGIIARKKDQIIKLFKLDERELEGIGTSSFFYHPCPIAQGAIGYFDNWLENRDNYYLNQFWSQVSWFEHNGQENNNKLLFPFPFHIPSFSDNKNWVSGMYQGQILSVFSRALLLSGKEKYFEMAQKTFNSFKTPLGEKHGFRYEDKHGLWFEEAPKFPPNHVLNGYIFAIWGIYDYYKLTRSKEALEIWQKCIETLQNALPKYDSGFWSYYSINKKLASYNYHNKIHVPQIKSMYKLTGRDIFYTMAKKWETYSKSHYSLIRKKIYHFFNF